MAAKTSWHRYESKLRHCHPPPTCLADGGFGPLPNTRFLWPTEVYVPNDISIGSAVFALITIVTITHTRTRTTERQ